MFLTGMRGLGIGVPGQEPRLHPCPGLLGIASTDNLVRIYDAETGELRQTVNLPVGSQVEQFAFFRDGARFATLETMVMNARPFTALRIWETASGGN